MAAEVADEQTPEPRWLAAGPPYEFTRGELLDLLRIIGHPMTKRRLQSWADYGLLPPPTRRAVPPGAPDGVARALYPVWVVGLVAELSRLSEQNQTVAEMQAALPDIREGLEGWAALDHGLDLLLKHRLIALRDGRPIARQLGEDWPTATAALVPTPTATVTSVDPRITRALQRVAWECAKDYFSTFR